MQTPTPRPPLSLGAIVAEAGGALLGGIVGGIAGYLIVNLLFAGADLGMALLGAQVYGVVIGFGVGAGTGTALAGRWLGQGGNVWLAMLGGVIGGVLLAVAMRVVPLRIDLFFLPAYAAVLSIAGAVLGYNLRRH